MIELKKDELLKDKLDYEDYSKNICNLSIEELKEYGLLQCNGCCLKNKEEKSNCKSCKSKQNCKK